MGNIIESCTRQNICCSNKKTRNLATAETREEIRKKRQEEQKEKQGAKEYGKR